MKTRNLPLLACLLAATAVAHAGITEVDDEINARIARIKIDRTGRNPNEKVVDARRGSSETDLLGDGCNIALGNIFQPAQTGIGTSARPQTTVVVQGDVIMANNRCGK
ncbi:MAG TPA: hypothetical protein VMG60_11590 [Burkholderiaceae bacterium]|nr:hypothetical protein [Burkholderiaceae bacterium]